MLFQPTASADGHRRPKFKQGVIVMVLDSSDLAFILSNLGGLFMAVVLLLFILSFSVRIVPEYRRLVLFRLGRLVGSRGPASSCSSRCWTGR